MMEDVRLLVQEEGRTARNLVAFHVPMNVGLSLSETNKRWPLRKAPTLSHPVGGVKKAVVTRPGQRASDGTRIRSASTGRDKKSELHARYWTFLLDNLHCAIGEIYSTCETDESSTECREAMLVLENYTRDFANLIEWFQVKSDAKPPCRPAFITLHPVPAKSSKPPGNQETPPGKVGDSKCQGDGSKRIKKDKEDHRELTSNAGNKETRKFGINTSTSPVGKTLVLPEVVVPKVVSEILTDFVPEKKSEVTPDLHHKVESSSTLVVYQNGLSTDDDTEVQEVVPVALPETDPASRSHVGNTHNEPVVPDAEQDAAVSSEAINDVAPCPVMIHEASQTDLELCVDAAGGIRFVPPPDKQPAKTPRPNYAAVSRQSCPRSMPRVQAPAKQIVVERPRKTPQADVRVRPSFPPRVNGRPVRSYSTLSSDNLRGTRSRADRIKAPVKQATVSVDVLPRTGVTNLEDDQQGWETVKGRSRSRWTPASQAKTKLGFTQLSNSSSLPALALSEVEVRLPLAAKHKSKEVSNSSPRGRKSSSDTAGKKAASGAASECRQAALVDPELAAKMEVFEDILEEELRKSRELSCQEAKLRQEIHELETIEIEVDTETEDEEQSRDDATQAETEVDWSEEAVDPPDDMVDEMTLEARYENVLCGMTWAERIDTLERLHEYVAHNPGRATELHRKLASPSRRRTIPETLRRFQTKQAQAKEKRERLAEERTNRLKELHAKVEEVKAAQEANIEKRRLLLDTKLQRAEANRRQYLKGIVRKAHDEEQKLKEIAFITELEAQNKRHDFMALCQEQEDRLQGIAEGRQRKQEEKAAKEAAVEERRRLLEAERQERLERMQELRREREERVGRAQQEKEKERQEMAREKARDRVERLTALHAAQLATQEELQKKIQQKQEESARRHEENMEHIRQRALESSILRTDDVAPRLAPYQVQKLCEICGVLIGSEVYLLSHLRGRTHQEAVQKLHEGAAREEIAVLNIRHIVDAPADKLDPRLAQDKKRQSALKKRCKKIRQRMFARGQDFETSHEVADKQDSPSKARLQKLVRDVDKLSKGQGKGQWSNAAITGLERALGEMNRILAKPGCAVDQSLFLAFAGFACVDAVLRLALDVPVNMAPFVPTKCLVTACTTLNLVCRNHPVNARYLLMSNNINTILDLLLSRLTVLMPEVSGSNPTALAVDALSDALMRLLALVLSTATPGDGLKTDAFKCRVQDVISYTVSVGVVDKLALYCGGVRDPIDAQPQAAQFLLSGLELLSTLTARCSAGGKAGGRDPTQLLVTLQVTELVGAVSMLYGMLLHQGAPPRGGTPPPPLPKHAVQVALSTVNLLTRIAELDLHIFQSVAGAEGISLQFRHIASYLLWYCSHDRDDDPLLLAVVQVVGFFAVKHRDNQMMLQSGYMPTVLQQLCNLPLPYFVNQSLSAILFPTLLACCVGNNENRAILEQEISYQSLEEFQNSAAAQKNSLMQLLNS